MSSIPLPQVSLEKGRLHDRLLGDIFAELETLINHRSMSDSLFSRDYFAKRGSWTAGNTSSRAPEQTEAKKRSSVLYSTVCPEPQRPSANELSSFLYGTYINELLANARTQKGSRDMQLAIKKATPDLLDAIVNEVCPITTSMMTDQYGNYLCQTLFQQATCAHRLQLLTQLRGCLLWLAKDNHGTHSLQTLVTMLSLNEEDELFRAELEEHVVELSIHPNGTHVVQKLLVHLRNNDFILRQIVTHALELATNQLGLCVIKKAISHGQMSPTKAMLQAQLVVNAIMLMQDPFGNYAIQHLLEELGPIPGLVSQLHGKIISLAMQKFSSNVVEKVLHICDEPTRRKIIQEMSHKDRIIAMLNSLYGCFVLKAAARMGNDRFKQVLAGEIKTLQGGTSNQKLQQRWRTIMEAMI